ncbi:hypothetical protein [Achromobacter aloeverae]|uniref:Uncharacterized protein n=1 Tax=Achromobacter aloeverae TaxID=1750518 RepID=A0A4Q1HH67_9BURK|nr:hypothetical protein [Achromobacter aloeverae]RXN86880.1 hypothetical protein C7R54_18415 [Achromobacter aloeverae]
MHVNTNGAVPQSEFQRGEPQRHDARGTTGEGAAALSFRSFPASAAGRAATTCCGGELFWPAAYTERKAIEIAAANESASRTVVHAQFALREGEGPSPYIAFPPGAAGTEAVPLELPNLRAYSVGDRWTVIPRPGKISMLECLLKAAICDGKRPEEARKILAEKPRFGPDDLGSWGIHETLLGERSGVQRYGSCEMLESMDRERWAKLWSVVKPERRLIHERMAADLVHQALESKFDMARGERQEPKFDYVLFLSQSHIPDKTWGRPTLAYQKLKLVHGVNLRECVISFRELPSGKCETAPVFAFDDNIESWTFYGFKKNKD